MKKVLMILLSVSLLANLSSYDNPATGSEAGKPRIAFVCKTLNSDFWTEMKRGAQASAEAHGVGVDVLAPTLETEIVEQKMLIDRLLAQDYGAICIAPCDEGAVSDSLTEAFQAGVNIVAVDTPLSRTPHDVLIGSDNIEGGRLAARRMGELFPERPQAQVAVMVGTHLPQTIVERMEGFQGEWEALGYKTMEPFSITSESWDEFAEIEAVLRKNPNLDGLLILKPDISPGALEMIQSSAPNTKIVVYDDTQTTRKALQMGQIDSYVAQDPYQMGWLAVEAAMMAMNGEIAQPVRFTDTQLVTAQDVEAFGTGRIQ